MSTKHVLGWLAAASMLISMIGIAFAWIITLISYTVTGHVIQEATALGYRTAAAGALALIGVLLITAFLPTSKKP